MSSFNVAVVAESPVSGTLRKTYALTNNVVVTKTRSTKAQRPRETRETLLRQTQRSMMFSAQIILPLKEVGGWTMSSFNVGVLFLFFNSVTPLYRRFYGIEL